VRSEFGEGVKSVEGTSGVPKSCISPFSSSTLSGEGTTETFTVERNEKEGGKRGRSMSNKVMVSVWSGIGLSLLIRVTVGVV